MLTQATWLSKLHEAQEKYQETVRTRTREVGEQSVAAAGSTSHGEAADMASMVHGGLSSTAAVPAHGDCRAAGASVTGRGWLDPAAATSLPVPSFAVYDYGELVRLSCDAFFV